MFVWKNVFEEDSQNKLVQSCTGCTTDVSCVNRDSQI